MTRIRKIEINHFRGINHFVWLPTSGVNCLIGPGDSGKSSILDAIDLCLGARKNAIFYDTDFYQLDVEKPITISITLGELSERLKNLDNYGLYLRGFKPDTGEILPEPEAGAEVVITVVLTVENDLEPSWALFSERAAEQGHSRNLAWADRVLLSPTRLGSTGDYNLSWRRGSILNQVSNERADASTILTNAAREARKSFGDTAKGQVGEALSLVETIAKSLGISASDITAMLDTQSMSFSGGTISLHDGHGVPLRNLGLGSIRLLIAGLQRQVANQTSILLVDEVEHGLEPHRIIRLIGSLGAKEKNPPLQVFMTTHSPVALRELSGDQLNVLRPSEKKHDLKKVGTENDIQATVRACPEAFLASSVLICEGASEIGLVRGLDLFGVERGKSSIAAHGVAIADGTGDNMYRRARTFAKLGYRTLILRDNDKNNPEQEALYLQEGGNVLTWRGSRALEDELFLSMNQAGVMALVDEAVTILDENLVDEHIKSASDGKITLAQCRETLSDTERLSLGKAAKSKKGSWFKSISAMEKVGKEIIGPHLNTCDPEFREIANDN